MRRFRRRRDWPWAVVFLAPALVAFATWVFYPLGRTIWLGTQRSDPFGLRTEYVGLDQYREVLDSSQFHNSLEVTFTYVIISVPIALVLGLGLAVLANTQLRGMRLFRTIFSSTVASSVAVSALLWFVLLQPSIGVVNQFLKSIGREPVDLLNDPDRALFAVSATSVWQNLGIVFVTVIAGLQAMPEELHEAARVDGHGAWSRFRNVTVPMISPTLLFTTVVLTIRAFQTFGEIDLLTQGGPNERTNVLTYALYTTVYKERDPGGGAALAVVLFVIILLLTMVQFRFLERRVHYAN
ncbi:MAG TPA: sugar ABC transporter permease [Acidimicrobiales bacterium]|nr:sugar ABC transporter permease [Acidimicrobiales bacterium]